MMNNAPAYLQDSSTLLSSKGFAVGEVWYHGTSSALLDSITTHGLKRSGDKAMNQAAKQTMATIGNHYTESIEPVFLTQSKELAFYWATQTVNRRSGRFQEGEQPVVLAVRLAGEQAGKVKPDVGAASLLLLPQGEQFMIHLAGIYQDCGLDIPNIDLMHAHRMDYLNKLGMAYIDQDIDASAITVVNA